MNNTLLLDFLWKNDITPEELADRINMPMEEFCRKFFGEDEFTTEEINRIADALDLTEQEIDWIFYEWSSEDDFLDEIFRRLKNG